MRCPKCQYISFDSGDRCRNCGYQLSLSAQEPLDLPIQTGREPEGPLADLILDAPDAADTAPSAAPPTSNAPVREPLRRTAASALDLPLFGDRGSRDDGPLVSAPAVPRPPLAVRKAAGSRLARNLQPEPELDLEPEEETPAIAPRPAIRPVDTGIEPVERVPAAAPVPKRLLAGLVDLAVIGSIDAGVLHFTLKICGLQYGEVAVLPVAPFAAFLLMLNGGYFVMFTAAGGQTIGKMVARLRVVPADSDDGSDRVPLGQAVLRSAAYLVSALPAGLGFLPALVGADKRAVHDRLAGTRVIKA